MELHDRKLRGLLSRRRQRGGLRGELDHNVYALNATTGAKLWSFTTGALVDSSLAFVNGVVYVGSEDHDVYALDATTGAMLWSFTTGNVVVSSPAVVNGTGGRGSDKVYAIGNPPTLTLASSPAVCAPDANSLDVFVQGTDDALWHEHFQSGSGWSAWETWESLGGTLTSSPGATSPSNGVIDVFVRGTDGAIWYKQFSGGACGPLGLSRRADPYRCRTSGLLMGRRSSRRLCARHRRPLVA